MEYEMLRQLSSFVAGAAREEEDKGSVSQVREGCCWGKRVATQGCGPSVHLSLSHFGRNLRIVRDMHRTTRHRAVIHCTPPRTLSPSGRP